MISSNSCYEVRCWDSWLNDWSMQSVTDLTFENAVKWALSLALFRDTMTEDGTEEVQVWVRTYTLGCSEMVGYVEYDPDDDSANENGFVYREMF